METDLSGYRSTPVVLKTIRRMPRAFINQIYAVDIALTVWVSLGTISYAAFAYYLEVQDGDRSCKASIGEQVASIEWTFQVQTAAFGAVLLLNLLNLGMRQHLLPFKCNLLLLYINAVAFATDLLLWRGSTAMLVSSSGRPFAPLRYVQWAHSTPSMIYMLALLADCRGLQLVIPLLNDVMMVATGLAACFTRGLLKDIMTVMSFVTFTVVLCFVYGMFAKTLSGDVSPEQRSTLRTVLALLLAVWTAFPVVWLAADWSLMGPQAEAICWGVCDYLAKVVFSSQLWQSNLTEVQLRRDRALEAWEATNRVEAVARLTALLKQRDDLLSTLSHELRTPLAGIVALSETLYPEVSAALPSSAQNLATVRATATCMLNIVTSTLDSFAARRGGLEPPGAASAADEAPSAPSVPLAPVDLRPLVETVTTVLRPLAHDGVAIVSELPGNLPLVLADVTRLNQVLYNLVGNAMRFTSHGEVKVAVRVVFPEGADTVPQPLPAPAPLLPPAGSAPPSVTGRRGCGCGGGGGGDCSATDPASSSTPTTASNTSSSNGGAGTGGIWRYTRPRLSQSSASSTCSSTVAGYPPGTLVEVAVEDTGVGIAQELLDELFMPYRTGQAVGQTAADSPRGDGPCGSANTGSGIRAPGARNIGGTGLGLYLVRLALRAQGSDVTAESAPGIGSVFRFRLQIAQPQQHPAKRAASLDMLHPHQQHHQHHQHHQQRQQQLVDDDVASGLHRLSVDCAEARSSCNSASDAAASAAGDCGAAGVPHSPRPTPATPSSPKPWIASATSRLMKLSTTAAAAGGRGMTGGNVSGKGAVAAAAAAAVGAPPVASVPARPRTSVLVMQHESGGASLLGRPLRMSLDDARGALRLPPSSPPPPPKAPPTAARCSPTCSGTCCVLEPSKRAACECSSKCEKEEVAEAAALALPALATAAAPAAAAAAAAAMPGGPASTMRSAATPAALTPAPTPTAAASRVSGGNVALLTPFDVAHAIEEGRALSRAGLRPNFRHRNQGILQVLSVDDDPINQLVAGQMLTSQSWKVVKCMNGPEALAHLQLMPRPGTAAAAAAAAAGYGGGDNATQASLAAAAAAAAPLLLPAVLPDCVLLDVMMPGMSGFEVCRKLREHFSAAQLPIIIVSAKGDTAAVDEAFESGADDYMTKPYKRTEMVARIKAQIRIRDSVLSVAVEAAGPAASLPAGSTTGSAPVFPISMLPPVELSVASLPMTGVAAAAAATPPLSGGTASAAPTATSTPRAACASSVAARALLGSGAATDVVPPPPGLSPLHPLAAVTSTADTRPTSVDVLLLQQQTTPDALKMRMEAARGGLDGSWGKAGLYKREKLLGRTVGLVAGVDAAAGAATAAATPIKDSLTAPAVILGSTNGDLLTQTSDAAAAFTAVAVIGAGGGEVAGSSGLSCSQEVSGVSHRRCLAAPAAATADAAVGSSRPRPTLPEGTDIVPVNVATADTGAMSAAEPSQGLLPLSPPRASNPGAVAAGAAGGGGDGGDGEPAEATALMREVLSEVRRGRAMEAEMEKLNSRVATLRTACCTLAAERDGWRRQARDLRALMAGSFSGAAAAAVAAAAAPPPPAGCWGAALTLSSKMPASGTAGPGTPTAHLALMEALATAHGSRSSGDSLGVGVAGAVGAASGAAGAAVAAQLEDLKKEAALLRQQLSIAMASVGNGSLALGPTDTTGSRTLVLASGAPALLRQQRSGLSAAAQSASDPRQSASGLPGGGGGSGTAAAAVRRAAMGDGDHSGGGAGEAAQQWGVTVFPNYADGNGPPDLFITTETSGLSAASGFVGGAACDGRCSGDGRGGKGGNGAGTVASRSPPSLGGMSISECRGASGKVQKRALASPLSGSALGASVTPPAPAGGGGSVGPAAQLGTPAAKHPNGDAPSPAAVVPAAVAAMPPPSANGAMAAAAPPPPAPQQQDAPAPYPTPTAAVGKAEPPQVFGELRGSSAASTGGRRSSVEDDMSMSQHSSAGRPPAGWGAAPGTATRGSRNRGGGGGAATTATTGILRMLCSKGAAPVPPAQASPTRRNSNQQ